MARAPAEAPESEREPENLDVRRIRWVAAGLLAATGVGVVAAAALIAGGLPRVKDLRPPRSMLPARTDGERTTLFRATPGAEERRRTARERLKGYGWVDRGARIAHVPIERAFELVLTEHARGAP